MKNLDLDKCWKLCKQMWKYVAGEVELRSTAEDVEVLKKIWLREHGFNPQDVAGNCFFCEYSEQIIKEFDIGVFSECDFCPGRLAEPAFYCGIDEYDYQNKPQAFYQEILRLDKIR